MIFSFDAEPPCGTLVVLDDQAFELVDAVPYTKADGSGVRLLKWMSPCAQCGEPFEQLSPFATSSLVRRCPMHRRPGKPAKGKRGRRLKVEIFMP
jgi:hypothetical protein